MFISQNYAARGGEVENYRLRRAHTLTRDLAQTVGAAKSSPAWAMGTRPKESFVGVVAMNTLAMKMQ